VADGEPDHHVALDQGGDGRRAPDASGGRSDGETTMAGVEEDRIFFFPLFRWRLRRINVWQKNKILGFFAK
jgi:hypothetical protein